MAESHQDGDSRTLAQREADLLAPWILGGEAPDGHTTAEAQIGLLVPIGTLAENAGRPGITASRQAAVPAPVVRYLIRSPEYPPTMALPVHHRQAASARAGAWGALLRSHRCGVQHGRGLIFRGPGSKLLREHIMLRDGTCRAEGCHRPADRGGIDHRIPWPAGPASAENLRALCRKHHNIKTRGFALTTVQKPQRRLPRAALWPLPASDYGAAA